MLGRVVISGWMGCFAMMYTRNMTCLVISGRMGFAMRTIRTLSCLLSCALPPFGGGDGGGEGYL